jgi:hypothetical protein
MWFFWFRGLGHSKIGLRRPPPVVESDLGRRSGGSQNADWNAMPGCCQICVA